ncbi:MAG: CarD family transcriptional regulator [Lachnospiraceae bacterium]|jgi:CarD family transcriptional regulator|nr:CarD family transcriptional regulator [Lachnospiraceae bacterium]
MFSVGDTVIYGNKGICRLVGTQTMATGHGAGDGADERMYYVLRPVFDEGSTIYTPMGNEKTESRMRRVLSAEEIHGLIREMPREETIWIEDQKERKERYKKILAENDRLSLVRLIKTIYLHGMDLRNKGRKLHVADEQFMKDAEKILYDEFAHVLGIARSEVLPYILGEIGVE